MVDSVTATTTAQQLTVSVDGSGGELTRRMQYRTPTINNRKRQEKKAGPGWVSYWRMGAFYGTLTPECMVVLL